MMGAPVLLTVVCLLLVATSVVRSQKEQTGLLQLHQLELRSEGRNKNGFATADYSCRDDVILSVLWMRFIDKTPIPVTGDDRFRVWTRQEEAKGPDICKTTLYIQHLPMVQNMAELPVQLIVQAFDNTDSRMEQVSTMAFPAVKSTAESPVVLTSSPQVISTPPASQRFRDGDDVVLTWIFTTSSPYLDLGMVRLEGPDPDRYEKTVFYKNPPGSNGAFSTNPSLRHIATVTSKPIGGGFNRTNVTLSIREAEYSDQGFYYVNVSTPLMERKGNLRLSTDLIYGHNDGLFSAGDMALRVSTCSSEVSGTRLTLTNSREDCIRCEAFGFEVDSVRLRKGSSDLTLSSGHHVTSYRSTPHSITTVYTISAPSNADSGSYTCRAEMSAFGTVQNKEFTVNVQGGPRPNQGQGGSGSRPTGTGSNQGQGGTGSRPSGTGSNQGQGGAGSRPSGTGSNQNQGASVSWPVGTGSSQGQGGAGSKPIGSGTNQGQGGAGSRPSGTGSNQNQGASVSWPVGTGSSQGQGGAGSSQGQSGTGSRPSGTRPITAQPLNVNITLKRWDVSKMVMECVVSGGSAASTLKFWNRGAADSYTTKHELRNQPGLYAITMRSYTDPKSGLSEPIGRLVVTKHSESVRRETYGCTATNRQDQPRDAFLTMKFQYPKEERPQFLQSNYDYNY